MQEILFAYGALYCVKYEVYYWLGMNLLPDNAPFVPSLDEFTCTARREFAFLVSELDFAEEPMPASEFGNVFQVRFIGSDCRVVVEGRSFGHAVAVTFERLSGGWGRLLDIMSLRCPSEAEPFRRFGDQRMLLKHAARCTRQHASDALRGEAEIYSAAEAQRHSLS